jgi:small subunit ribosomal protein S7
VRRNRAPVRNFAPDSIYGSVEVTRFINALMLSGKKHLAENIFYSAMNIIKEKSEKDPIEVFNQAFENVKPILEVKSRRVGGATYQVPIEVRPARVNSLATKWLVKYSRIRKEKGMENKLAKELMDAAKSQGGAVQKKDEIHRMAESNKAFACYRW